MKKTDSFISTASIFTDLEAAKRFGRENRRNRDFRPDAFKTCQIVTGRASALPFFTD